MDLEFPASSWWLVWGAAPQQNASSACSVPWLLPCSGSGLHNLLCSRAFTHPRRPGTTLGPRCDLSVVAMPFSVLFSQGLFSQPIYSFSWQTFQQVSLCLGKTKHTKAIGLAICEVPIA